jgi:hypothetical protein
MPELTLSHSQGSMNSATGQRFANDSIALERCQQNNIFTKIQAARTKKPTLKNSGSGLKMLVCAYLFSFYDLIRTRYLSNPRGFSALIKRKSNFPHI